MTFFAKHAVWIIAGVVVMGVGALLARPLIRAIFYPPEVTLEEAYEDSTDTTLERAHFDHSSLTATLRQCVQPGGYVDYVALGSDSSQLDRYIESLASAPFHELTRDDKLAFLINSYNACTLRLILDHYPVASIRDIPSARRWKDRRWDIAGRLLSLEQIEHMEIRAKFREPRIHFALVCASIGCPPLRREAYLGEQLETQLTEQTQSVHSNPRWFAFDGQTSHLQLTQLYDWYRNDFEQACGGPVRFAAKFSKELADTVESIGEPTIHWLEYDWSLNSAVDRD